MQDVKGNSSGLSICLENGDEIKRIYELLQDDGTIEIELGETFFAELFGMVVDKFGILWQIRKELPVH